MHVKSLLALSSVVASVIGAPVLEARTTGTMTWYNPRGVGACGSAISSSQYAVALTPANYANGAHCGKNITVTANGKTARATVLDSCPACSTGGIDATQGFFSYFAPTSQGSISVTWSFV